MKFDYDIELDQVLVYQRIYEKIGKAFSKKSSLDKLKSLLKIKPLEKEKIP